MKQPRTARHDALQSEFAAGAPDGASWPVWIVDVAESEHQAEDLITTIDILDFGTMLTWRQLAQPMLTVLRADHTGLSLHLAPSPVGDDVRRVCLMALHGQASAVMSISWHESSPCPPQHLMAWPSPRKAENGKVEIHLIILPACRSCAPWLQAARPAGVCADATQNWS